MINDIIAETIFQEGIKRNDILLLKIIKLKVEEYRVDSSVPNPDGFHCGIETACDEVMDMLNAMLAERGENNNE